MKFLLRLRHWQIFLLTWGIPIIIDIYTFSDPGLLIKLFPIMMLTFFGTFFGWVWAISVELNKLLPNDTRLSVNRFKLIFSFSLIYIVVINLFLLFPEHTALPKTASFSIALIPVHLFAMFSILYGCNFAGRTIKTLELGRIATTAESQKEFGQVAILFIGVWSLQPTLDKIIADKA